MMKHVYILLVVAVLLAACGRVMEQPQIEPTLRPTDAPVADATEAVEASVDAAVEATMEATPEMTVEATVEATAEATAVAVLPPDAPVTVADAGMTADTALGEDLFLHGRDGAVPCAGCHSNHDDVRLVGPGLLTVAQRAATRVDGMTASDYLHESIVDPSAFVVAGYINMMPKDFGTIYTPQEVDAIVAYLMSLGQPAAEVASADTNAG